MNDCRSSTAIESLVCALPGAFCALSISDMSICLQALLMSHVALHISHHDHSTTSTLCVWLLCRPCRGCVPAQGLLVSCGGEAREQGCCSVDCMCVFSQGDCAVLQTAGEVQGRLVLVRTYGRPWWCRWQVDAAYATAVRASTTPTLQGFRTHQAVDWCTGV